MKKTFIIAVFAILFAAVAVSAKKNKGVYLLGASLSFSDSIVYFTEVQFLDSIKLEKRTKFLPDRQFYATELKDFMALEQNMSGRTSVIYYAKSASKLNKKAAKLRKRIIKKGGVVRYLGDKFSFTRF